jgi:hypothetical protein
MQYFMLANSNKQFARIVGTGNLLSAAEDIFKSSVAPFASSIKSSKLKVGSGFTLSTHQFAAPPDIVLHPGREEKVKRVPLDFTDMKRGAGYHVRHVICARFNHEIRTSHLPPELCLDRKTNEIAAQIPEGIHDQEMGANMGAIPVLLVWKENDMRTLRAQDF